MSTTATHRESRSRAEWVGVAIKADRRLEGGPSDDQVHDRPLRPGPHGSHRVELSLDAWAPVFASFRAVLGDDLYQRVHPDWRRDQATSVRAALAANDTLVAITDDDITGFVNVVFDQAERSGEIYMIAVDPRAQRQGIANAQCELGGTPSNSIDADDPATKRFCSAGGNSSGPTLVTVATALTTLDGVIGNVPGGAGESPRPGCNRRRRR